MYLLVFEVRLLQFDPEDAASLRVLLITDISTHQLNQLPTNSQSKTTTLYGAISELYKWGKYLATVSLTDTDTGIGHRKVHNPARLYPGIDSDAAILTVKFNRVSDQAGQNILQPGFIGSN